MPSESQKRSRDENGEDDFEYDSDGGESDHEEDVFHNIANMVYNANDNSEYVQACMETFSTRARSTQSDGWASHAESVRSIGIDKESPASDIVQAIFFTHALFCTFSETSSFGDRLVALYPTYDALEANNLIYKNLSATLISAAGSAGLFNENSSAAIQTAMEEIHSNIYVMSQAAVFTFRAVNVANQHAIDVCLTHTDDYIASESSLLDRPKPVQLIQFAIKKFHMNGLRRVGTDLFQPILNSSGQFVHAYKLKSTIVEELYNLVGDGQNIDLQHWYDLLITTPQCVITSNLSAIRDVRFVDHVTQQELHSFTDGVFDFITGDFYRLERDERLARMDSTYHHVSELPKTARTACAYHDLSFLENTGGDAEFGGDIEYDENGETALDDTSLRAHEDYEDLTFLYESIPSLDSIFHCQGFDMIEKLFILGVGLGHLFLRLGTTTSWHTLPIVVGVAGTGKSTILQFVASCFEEVSSGYFCNNLQQSFQLGHLADDRVNRYFGLDVDENFRLDQATLQSLVSNEVVSVVAKNKEARGLRLGMPGAFACNVLPNWNDKGGSLARRLFIIEFCKAILKVDGTLTERMRKDKPRIIRLISRCHRYLAKKYGDKFINDFAPPRFKDAHKRYMAGLNSLVGFMEEGCAVVENDKEGVLYKTFVKAHKKYTKSNNLTLRKLDVNPTITFASFKGVIEIEHRVNPNLKKPEVYILGLSINQDYLED